MAVAYAELADAVAEVGMIARGGFAASDGTGEPPGLDDGRPTRTVVIIGNVAGAMWQRFVDERSAGPDPLDRWTREVLRPIAERFDGSFVHPSDEPFQPFQRWACLADDVWPSPIGLLVHPTFGLWHAYRGAFLFATDVDGLPVVGERTSPCLTCADRPCLSTCPVGAFTDAGYDVDACVAHVRSGAEPECLRGGCAARCACPVGRDLRYEPEQMRFHMEAFVGMPA